MQQVDYQLELIDMLPNMISLFRSIDLNSLFKQTI